jgi:hypothetical protein
MDTIQELNKEAILKAQINAFNEGFKLGEKLAREKYNGK